MHTTSPTVSETLRQSILDHLDGMRAAEIGGVDQNVIGRFLRGDGLPVTAVDALARGLGLQLVAGPLPPPIAEATTRPTATRPKPKRIASTV